MDFEEFWAILTTELEQPTRCETRNNTEFFAHYYGNYIHLTLSQEQPWEKISKEKMENIWNIARDLDDDRRFVTTEYQDITRSASYVLTLIETYLNDEEMK